ncbi:hypothetical protein AR687_10475 [Flavobacteriaceae bacterium CRH]|nr:hypothetical protein AR687_10475 [Flavobacteriaceae bacterium CRH]
MAQDKFQQEFNLNYYDNWFYDQNTGILTFSTGNQELNFRYFDVGSFSTKSNTWKWSWNNNYTLEKVKKQTKTIRDFGTKSDFPKLTDGYFESDEIEAWELTAIAFKIEKGIGVYRPVDENKLQIFLAITELIDNETAQKIKDKYVECGTHDSNRIAFVCTHLNKETKVGFNEAFETSEDMELEDDDDFQAWCNDCETIRKKEDGWTDHAIDFAKIKIVCERCYFEIKELNQ